ncbi:GNAT family N-acetyltransferase [Nonomuraea soli]|uniref:GNAT superfamily N-acetyltransferase n=1 Tax=Nonomuraea soli TaxID=1032476 RepID=A0A7W0HVL1_9ACTN|nr:GNAT family N-acetyltransferase [Nonomuraea soli]MBA2896906.1 GNAT superfamily N-acetyltransferase [Nonomuraea soli]
MSSPGHRRVRTFLPGDEQALVEAWNLSMPADPVTSRWWRDKVLLDPNFDPGGLIVADDAGRVAGCAYAIRRLTPLAPGLDLEPETGWIPFLFVTPEHRGSGLGARLLEAALEFLRDRRRVDFACYTPHYLLPGVDPELYPAAGALLRGRGFEKVTTAVAMDRGLAAYAPPPTGLPSGYEVREPVDGELPELVRFAAGFNPDWGEAIRKFRDNARLLIARNDRIVGFTAYGAYEGPAERFGPFGVDPEERGAGLGKILLHRTLARMRAEGLHTAWFLWTGQDTPAYHLYLKAGFHVTRTFDVMRLRHHSRP